MKEFLKENPGKSNVIILDGKITIITIIKVYALWLKKHRA